MQVDRIRSSVDEQTRACVALTRALHAALPSVVHGLPSTHPAGTKRRQRWSQVGQPGGSHSSGKLTVELPHTGQGTRQSLGVLGAVHVCFVTCVKAGVMVAPAVTGGAPVTR